MPASPFLLLVAALVAGDWVALTVTMIPDPPPVPAEDVTIDVPKGPGGTGQVRLDATVYRPAVTPAPAVLVAYGFGGSNDSVRAEATALGLPWFRRARLDRPGTGASAGQIELDSPSPTLSFYASLTLRSSGWPPRSWPTGR